jgi:hypothetical protein
MRLFFYNKVDDITIFHNARLLMESAYKSGRLDLKTADFLNSVKALEDPVRDFIDLYFKDQGVSISDMDKRYIINRLYAAKGGVEIFNVMEETFGAPGGDTSGGIEFKVGYKYEFPDLTEVCFNEFKVSDLEMFLSSFERMVYVLLFYDKIKFLIEHLTLRLTGTLKQYILVSATPYTIINTQEVE